MHIADGVHIETRVTNIFESCAILAESWQKKKTPTHRKQSIHFDKQIILIINKYQSTISINNQRSTRSIQQLT